MSDFQDSVNDSSGHRHNQWHTMKIDGVWDLIYLVAPSPSYNDVAGAMSLDLSHWLNGPVIRLHICKF